MTNKEYQERYKEQCKIIIEVRRSEKEYKDLCATQEETLTKYRELIKLYEENNRKKDELIDLLEETVTYYKEYIDKAKQYIKQRRAQ